MHTLETFDEDASAMGRIRVWEAAWLLAVRRPLVGGGFRAVYQQDIVNMVAPHIRARATHSIWFEALGEHGFPGFFIWLGVIIAGIVYSMRITRMAKDRPDLRWASDLARMSQVSVVAYAVGGTFLSLAYWDFFWTLMVVLGAVHGLVAQAVRNPAAAVGAPADAPPGRGWRTQAGLAGTGAGLAVRRTS
jgi:probable O-glycosylation ligase (exosortase A-associated)